MLCDARGRGSARAAGCRTRRAERRKRRLIPILRAEEPTTRDRFGEGDGACGAAVEPGVAGRTAFTLRVQTGCAQTCSYCIIPATRGAPRSITIHDALREVERAATAGFKEIALTGVHLGSYGRDLAPRSSLVELLRSVERWSAKASAERPAGHDLLFRVSSLEPMDCSTEIVDLVGSSRVFAPHFHLPLQHASDRMLRLMRRPYGIAYYARLVDRIRRQIPNASIGADIIVGFPGETDHDFEQLATYLERSPLTHLHVFPYSDRPGTVASQMNGRIPGAVVRERARRIRETGQCLIRAFRSSQVGTVHRALTLENGATAVTANYIKVSIPPGRPRNEWVTLRIASHDHGELLAG